MASPIQVTNEDIKALTDRNLVYLLWQLLNLELGTNNIEKYDSQVPLSIYIKDGGIDGIARWEDGPEKTSYLPGRIVGFQAKATDMPEASCASEVKTKDGRLKPQVRRLVEGGGVYVLFLGRDCVEQSKVPRIKALKKGIESASTAVGGTAVSDPDVRILDASDIAAWVNSYPAAVARVGYFLGKRYDNGMSWEEMSGYRDLQIPYAESDEARITAIQSIRQASKTPRNIIRIVGSSGLGKTRLVFEAFRPPPDTDPASAPEQAKLSSLYCYISATKVQDVEQLVADWRRLNRSGVVIVDDCTYELHGRLSEEVTRADSHLTLITIGNDHEATAYAGTDTKLLAIKPTTDNAISTLLETAFGDLSVDDREFISRELAQGYPQMAILVAQARMANVPLSARLTPEVLAKLLGRPVESGSTAEKVISVCSLFEYIGINGALAHEREFARAVFCPEISAEDFYSNIVEFSKCGAVSRYGRLAQVRPKPLAIRLAADWWERCSPELAARIVEANFPEGLANAFCERLRMLDFVPALLDTTTQLCGPQGPFGQAKVLNSELGSRLFRAIAEVNPLAAISALCNAFGSFDESRFLEIAGDPRRNLVWALEKLCFRTDTFSIGADLLSRLAASENETWSNNSTGIFSRLFMVLLPGTQAPLEQRLPVLRAVARSDSPRMRAVAVTALENAIRTSHFTGTSGPEYQGSAGPLPQYRPKLWKEVFEYWSSCLEELVRLAVTDPATSEAAASAIAANIRGLIQQGRLDDVESAVDKVAAARGGIWPKALDGIKDSLKFEGKGFSEDARLRMESWLEKLEPNDLAGKLALHVSDAPFEHEEAEDGHWRDVAAERAEQLGVSCAADWPSLLSHLSATLRGHQKQAFMFGRGLAKGIEYSEHSFSEIVALLSDISFEERNSDVLSGWLSTLDEVDPVRVDDAFGQLANRSEMAQSLPAICRGLKLNDFRVSELTRLLHEGVISVKQLHGISYGQSMAAVSPIVVSDLCQELLAISVEGAWVALDVAFMYVYSDSTKWSALVPTLKSILSTEGMLRAAKPEWRMDAHAFAKVAEKLVEHDKELAAILTREVIDTTMQSKHVPGIDHCMEEVLASLLEKQVVTVWPLVASALEGPDNLTQWQLADLLRNRLGEAEGDLLGKIPFEYLAQWSAESPEVAPAILAGIVQVMKNTGDDSWALSTEAMFLLDNYGNNTSVLSALGANINSFSWSGSLVPFFKRQMTVLQPLKKHPIAEVRQWSQRLIESAAHQVQKETTRDEEMEIGRFS